MIKIKQRARLAIALVLRFAGMFLTTCALCFVAFATIDCAQHATRPDEFVIPFSFAVYISVFFVLVGRLCLICGRNLSIQ